MMYSDKLVVCIKANGKILREFKDEVYIPYGTEYSILVKNLNSVRASVDISIDGKNVIKHGSLVVNGNSETEVERFVVTNNSGNRFKFIERTGAVENHRGIKADDGLIRIAFRYEKVIHKTITHTHETHVHHHHDYLYHKQFMPPQPTIWYGTAGIGGSSAGDVPIASAFTAQSAVPSALRGSVSGMALNSVKTASAKASNLKAEHPLQNDVGVTVEGSKSDQQFKSVGNFELEAEEHVMVLRLLGDLGQNKKVEKPVTVKSKITCGTCGTRTKPTARFCPDCGTAVGLELVA